MNTPSTHPVLTVDPATDHIQGPTSALATLVEYGDFECPSCAQMHGAIKVLRNHFHSDLRFVFRHFPLREVHPHAELAAEAAEAAAAQGKFWPMYDLLFEKQQHLESSNLFDYAQKLGLDTARFENELRDHVYLQRVQEHMASGQRNHVRATPSFFLNGVFVDVSFGLDRLHQAVEAVVTSGKSA